MLSLSRLRARGNARQRRVAPGRPCLLKFRQAPIEGAPRSSQWLSAGWRHEHPVDRVAADFERLGDVGGHFTLGLQFAHPRGLYRGRTAIVDAAPRSLPPRPLRPQTGWSCRSRPPTSSRRALPARWWQTVRDCDGRPFAISCSPGVDAACGNDDFRRSFMPVRLSARGVLNRRCVAMSCSRFW
jgi:hypothetical protein